LSDPLSLSAVSDDEELGDAAAAGEAAVEALEGRINLGEIWLFQPADSERGFNRWVAVSSSDAVNFNHRDFTGFLIVPPAGFPNRTPVVYAWCVFLPDRSEATKQAAVAWVREWREDSESPSDRRAWRRLENALEEGPFATYFGCTMEAVARYSSRVGRNQHGMTAVHSVLAAEAADADSDCPLSFAFGMLAAGPLQPNDDAAKAY